MLGAIVGDIVGSVYEWNNIKTKDFPLFGDGCFFTDDTVMTIAAADAIMNGAKREDFISAYKKWGRLYPNSGYGARFGSWIFSEDGEAYNSWGNGSAMRVSPCAWVMERAFYSKTDFRQMDEWKCVTYCADVTHNHPEGIKGAQAVAAAIFFCRCYAKNYGTGMSEARRMEELKSIIKTYTEANFGYNLSRTLDEIRPVYRFNESCQETVPEAITAFLESTGFEDAIRNAISLGGDSDTLAAITGSIAEAAYGIPAPIREKALGYLDKPLRDVYESWQILVRSLDGF
ncbi:MAG: ADP-ribosylglycohydrolase family protein [Clostridiales bacterium]|jgi:ADP-ribosylglycohydrolase|nr:ADP-ribosylglycohydrolase family protein [Clostridiales bacterium]